MPSTWRLTHMSDVLLEGDLAEAWLLMRLKAGIRISRIAEMLVLALADRLAAGKP